MKNEKIYTFVDEYDIVNEAKVFNTQLSEEDVKKKTMEIGLITDKIVMNSNLGRVADPLGFSKVKDQSIPTPEGLFSTDIFGTTTDERRRLFGYIDLGTKFFHPYVYEILCKLNGKIEQVVAGRGSWKIENGELIKVDEEYDDDGDIIPGDTGLDWMVENFKHLKFDTNTSQTRNERVRMIKNLSHEEIFISKWLVIPVFYRDITVKGKQTSIPEINKLYGKLISYTNSLQDNVFNIYDNTAKYNIQTCLVDVRKYGQDIIGGKHGIFRKSILGKSIDRGSRDVISTPTMDGCLRPGDNQVDIRHSGIPLSKCIVIGYNFILKYCLDFFANNFKNIHEYPIYRRKNGSVEIAGSVKIKDQVDIFNIKYIEKKMKLFISTPATRFDTINITTEDGKLIPMNFSGMFTGSGDIINRSFTWCDLFYMAAHATIHDKFVYITRFPIESENSQFPTQVVALTTLTTEDITVNDIRYTHYPKIDLSMTEAQLRNNFIDTVTFSNLFLKAIGGDYDGDTTIQKMVFSLEANEEAERIVNSPRYYLNTAGKLNKTLSNESTFLFYNMTKRG